MPLYDYDKPVTGQLHTPSSSGTVSMLDNFIFPAGKSYLRSFYGWKLSKGKLFGVGIVWGETCRGGNYSRELLRLNCLGAN